MIILLCVNAFNYSYPCIQVNAAKEKVLFLRSSEEIRSPCEMPQEQCYPFVSRAESRQKVLDKYYTL